MSTTNENISRENYLTADYSLKSWLLTLDHKRIGILYLLSIAVFFFIGGAFAFVLALSEGGLPLAIGVLSVVLVVNIGLENLLEPKLVGTSLNMHPIVVLLVTLAGGLIAGIVGLILAAPTVAIGYHLYKELEAAGFFDTEPQPDVT